jgi:hypothetical protein
MYEEKKSLLLEMIAFQQLMVICIKKEYEFLFLIANQLNIEKLMIYFIKNYQSYL